MNEESPQIKEYFENMNKKIAIALEIANKAREKHLDPDTKVEISLAANMAERVEGLISMLAPQIKRSGVVERIIELEKQYGTLDWRVALKIAEEVAEEKFCKFKDKIEAIEIGIRTGFAYVTVGVVSSPLDGMIGISIKKRKDGKDYMCVNYAGPIRNAGGTAASVSAIIADYVRQKQGYAKYDVQEDEIKRAVTELRDYHERVTNLQYYPSPQEIEHMMKNLPVEISGDPSEKIEVSNYKDLERVETNCIRSGYCLMLSSCIPLKAPKLWKQLSKWGKEFGIDSWDFLEEFLKIQKAAKAKKTTKTEDTTTEKISPDYTYIKDLVAGRPVLGYPLRPGGFRLRYGRSRISGYSCQSIHPATMHILNQYIAAGTQLKTERPGKSTIVMPCDTIEGPIVKLKDGTVLQLHSLEEAKQYNKEIEKILFLGDILIAYGDFFNRAHTLIPPGYCEEWWEQETKQEKKPKVKEAIKFAIETKTPLHPAYTHHWKLISKQELLELLKWFKKGKKYTKNSLIEKIVLGKSKTKEILEKMGMPHKYINNEFTILEEQEAEVINAMFPQEKIDEILTKIEKENLEVLEILNKILPFKIRDKSGVFIGSRMGRPEKAKQRKLTGNPHVLFPVGAEGGRLRCFQSALEKGSIISDFPYFYCSKCNKETVFSSCEDCGSPTKQKWKCSICGLQDTKKCSKHNKIDERTGKEIENKAFRTKTIPIKEYFNKSLKLLGTRNYPELIKGVRGTSNKEHIPEHLAKGILRAKYGIHVYKDGTTRYDMIQMPITHFKPQEIGTSIEKLKELGYLCDIYGKDLVDLTQILEIKPQDIILPGETKSVEAGANKVLSDVSKFIDDLLVNFYKQEPYYKIKKMDDLVGKLTIVLAPHTSAGIIGRIIGFTQLQGLLAHPLLHAATRRDCDGDEACVVLLMDAFLNFSKKFLPGTRGATMDTPLVLTSKLIPSEVDDMVFDLDITDKYPLEFYQAAQEYKKPWDVKIKQLGQELHKEGQYEGMFFTHDTTDLNETVKCSAYKTLPSMAEKLDGQMQIAEKLMSVNDFDVAALVIDKHLIKDTKGNLRKFSTQQFRCVKCNEKFRRPPLAGKCSKCGGRIIFTVSEGSSGSSQLNELLLTISSAG